MSALLPITDAGRHITSQHALGAKPKGKESPRGLVLWISCSHSTLVLASTQHRQAAPLTHPQFSASFPPVLTPLKQRLVPTPRAPHRAHRQAWLLQPRAVVSVHCATRAQTPA